MSHVVRPCLVRIGGCPTFDSPMDRTMRSIHVATAKFAVLSNNDFNIIVGLFSYRDTN